MGISTMADRMVWPPSLSRDRKWPCLNKCTHSQEVSLRLEGTLVLLIKRICFTPFKNSWFLKRLASLGRGYIFVTPANCLNPNLLHSYKIYADVGELDVIGPGSIVVRRLREETLTVRIHWRVWCHLQSANSAVYQRRPIYMTAFFVYSERSPARIGHPIP